MYFKFFIKFFFRVLALLGLTLIDMPVNNWNHFCCPPLISCLNLNGRIMKAFQIMSSLGIPGKFLETQ